jgi:hypothetical protein
MAPNFEFTLQNKSDYLKLSNEISQLRNDGKDVPKSLLLKAFTAGCLANIPDDELNVLLSDLKKNN